MLTGPDGCYTFTGLPPGTYTVTETQPPGFLDGFDQLGSFGGTPANDRFSAIVLPPGGVGVDYNFGEIIPSSIGGIAYFDVNTSGVFEPGLDTPLANVVVTLTGTDVDGRQVARQALTGPDGSYLFTGLRGGNYTVTETQPVGFIDAATNLGTQGGSARPNVISAQLGVGENGRLNNFGEVALPGTDVGKQQLLNTPATGTVSAAQNGTLPPTPSFANSPSRTGLGFSQDPALNVAKYVAVASQSIGVVEVYDYTSGQQRFTFAPFGTNFAGGLSVATGDINGDGVEDIIIGAASGAPIVVAYDGKTGQLERAFFAMPAASGMGVTLAAADVNRDGRADIIVGASSGTSLVQVFDGLTGGAISAYYAFAPAFAGGVNVAAGDIDADGIGDVIASVRSNGPPIVQVFDGLTGGLKSAFFAFAPGYLGGVSVAAGDVDGDGRAEIITGTGAGVPGTVVVYSAGGSAISAVSAFGNTSTAGVNVAAQDTNGDGRADVIMGERRGGSSRVRIADVRSGSTLDSFAPLQLGDGLSVG